MHRWRLFLQPSTSCDHYLYLPNIFTFCTAHVKPLYPSYRTMIEPCLGLKDDIASARTDPTFHDVVIICADGVEIGACRTILALRSPFFKAMFYGSMQESTSRSVTLQTIKSTVMEAVLCFIYMEDIDSVANALVIDLYLAAEFFLLPSLKKLVLERIQGNYNLETAVLLLNKSVEFVPWSESAKDLYGILLTLFCAQPLAVGSLKELSGEALELLLTRTATWEFKTSEYDLFLCVTEWAWARDDSAPSFDDRRAACDAINIDGKSPLENGPSGTSLVKVFRHLDLTLIRPHLLKPGTEAGDVLGKTAEFSQSESNICKFPQQGYFFIRSALRGNVLDVCAASMEPGRRIIIHAQNSPKHINNQLWSCQNGFLTSKNSDLVIDCQLELRRTICQYNRKKTNKINNQRWAFDSEGFIYCISNPNLVLDVDSTGAAVFLYTRKSKDNLSQKWEIFEG